MGQPTILIYTMGKVGSTSLYSALKNSRLNLPLVYHIHFLTKPNINKTIKPPDSTDIKSIIFNF